MKNLSTLGIVAGTLLLAGSQFIYTVYPGDRVTSSLSRS